MLRRKCLSSAESALRSFQPFGREVRAAHRCHIATQTSTTPSSKAAGDISSVFPSLSDNIASPLPPRFAALKTRLIAGHEDRLQAGWHELLESLKKEKEIIRSWGSALIPEIEYRDIDDPQKRTKFRDSLRQRGVAVIRAVVSEREALDWKELLLRYIKTNPEVRGRSLYYGYRLDYIAAPEASLTVSFIRLHNSFTSASLGSMFLRCSELGYRV